MSEVVVANCQVYFEVLSNAPHYWSKCALHLPVNSVIEHVEQDYGLVTHENVLVTK